MVSVSPWRVLIHYMSTSGENLRTPSLNESCFLKDTGLYLAEGKLRNTPVDFALFCEALPTIMACASVQL